MADEKAPIRPGASEAAAGPSPQAPAKKKEVDALLARARQTIKPIINREAANEIVSDDLLNFRMKGCRKE